MSKVQALRIKDVSPTVVIESVASELPNLRDLYVVAFNKEGEMMLWSSGDLKSLSMAAIGLQDLALKHLNGCIDRDEEIKT